MLEDKWLVWKFKNGSTDAFRCIYEKYKNDLLALAVSLIDDRSSAEDIVHDVFVSFAQSANKLQIRKSLKGYLLTSVANRIRSRSRIKIQQPLEERATVISNSDWPEQAAMSAEQTQQINNAILGLPCEQREVIMLHLQNGLRFREIAKSLAVSISTVQSRYRYGLNKLQLILNGEVEK
ncbi:MAG: RNA polymerase sigma factor [Planctomycetota bacterium]|jgi:RNA polymerase sigma-70 factor (ECF subfamily)